MTALTQSSQGVGKDLASSRKTLWTIRKMLGWSNDYFARFDIDSPRLTAELLLAHTLNLRRLDLYLQFDRPLNPDELATYKTLIQRRVKLREPVAYITGEKGFWNGEFLVSPHVLIPRPDTEALVEQAISEIQRLGEGGRRLKVLDLGTGSGAIVLSLAQSCPEHLFFAMDRSCEAIQVARRNLARQALPMETASAPSGGDVISETDGGDGRISLDDLDRESVKKDLSPTVQFWVGSWLESLKQDVRFDLIVSNPPYIVTNEIKGLQPEIKDHEPISALDGGKDGFDCFRQILLTAASCLSVDGVLMMEMGADQQEQMKKEVVAASLYTQPRFVKDYAGHDRVVILSRK